MKKFIFILIVLCFPLWGSSQVLGTPIQYWDFANGLPSGWTLGSTTPLATWEYRGPTTTPNNTFSSVGSCSYGQNAIASITASNGFMIFDSNYWDDNGPDCGGNMGGGPDPGPHTAWMITESIDLTGIAQVNITFQQQLRSYTATTKVQYSINNGSTWNDIPALTQGNYITSPIVQWKSANIAALVGNQPNVKFKFLFNGYYYHWCIDDITLYIPSQNNLALINPQYTVYDNSVNEFINMPFDQYPTFAAPVIIPNASLQNMGVNTQTQSVLHTQVINTNTNTVVDDQTSPPIDIPDGDTIYTQQNSFPVPNTLAHYIVTYEVDQAQTDQNPVNNVDTLDFDITTYCFGRDEQETDNLYNCNTLYPNTVATEVGTLFRLPVLGTKKIASMQVCIAQGTQPGTIIKGFLYLPSMDSILAETQTYEVNLADINSLGENRIITLPLLTPFVLSDANLNYGTVVIDTATMESAPNEFNYVVAAMVRNMSPGTPFYVSRSGPAPPNTTYLHFPDNQDLYYLLRIPMVRLNAFNLAQTPGCTVDSAMNYNPLANIDDGSCDYPGCTTPGFDNYIPWSNWDDGSCAHIGCPDPNSLNYYPNPDILEPCIYAGCLDPLADNFNPLATVDDSSCFYLGCMDPIADNYDTLATIDDGSCYYLGCTDPTAQNFDPTATLDDGSCLFPGCTDPIADNFDANANVDDGSCFYLGCMDPSADNFDPGATVDDGSCYYLGCMDPLADNFDPTATIDDGGCLYYGCTDPTAMNFDVDANFNDGSCIYTFASLFSLSTHACIPATFNVVNQTTPIPGGSCEFILPDGSTITTCVPSFNVTISTLETLPVVYHFTYDGFVSSDTLWLTGDPHPEVPIIDENNGFVLCTNCPGGLTYQWNLNNNNLPGATGSLFNNNLSSNYLSGYFGLAVANSLGCSTNATPVLVLAPKFSIVDNSICQNETLTVNNQMVTVPGVSCIMHWGDGLTSPAAPSLSHNYATDGDYTLEMVCSLGQDTGWYSLNASIHPLPTIPLITYSMPVVSCSNFIPAEIHQWFRNDTLLTSTGTSTSIFFNSIYHNGLYHLTTTNSFGCTSTSADLVVIQPVFSSNPTHVCPGTPINLVNLTQIWENLSCTVDWGDGYFDIAGPLSQHTYLDSGSYTITLDCQNGYGANSINGIYTTHPLPPTPELNYSLGTVFCSNPDPGSTYQWTLNTNPLPGATNASHNTFTGAFFESGWFDLYATNMYGCSVQSQPFYVLQPFFNFPNNLTCTADGTTLSNLTQDLGISNCTIQWGDGQTTTGNNLQETHFYNYGNTFNVSMYCENQDGYGYYTETVTTLASPTIPLLSYQQPTVSCINCSLTNALQWSIFQNPIANATSSNYSTWTGATYTNGPYSLEQIASNGCTAYSDTLDVVQPFFTSSPDSICSGDTVQVNNLTDAQFWLNCTIDWGDGIEEPISGTSASHAYNNSGLNEISITCDHNGTVNQFTQQTMVMPTPQASLVESNNVITCTNCQSSWIFSWELDSVFHPEFNQVTALSADLAVLYVIQTTSNFGCQSSDSITTDFIPPAVIEINLDQLIVYPNPTSEYIQFQVDQPSWISIFNAEGKQVMQEKVNSGLSQLSVKNLATGTYNLYLTTPMNKKAARFMVSRKNQ